MVILIVECIILGFSSFLFINKLFSAGRFSELALKWFILFFSQIVLVCLFLGMAGKLYIWNVFFAHALILILACIFCYRDSGLRFRKPDIDFFFKSNILLYAFSVFAMFFLCKIFVNLVNPPISPGSWQQHLLFPATWIVSGNLDNPFQIFGSIPLINPAGFETSSASYYPINAQLFYAWLMLPLRNAFLADAGEAPFYLIGIIAVYSILTSYNVKKWLALLIGFAWALIPNLFKQLRVGSEIDVICAVLLLLVFQAAIWLRKDFTFKNIVLFGAIVGLLVGTKIINLTWLAASFPFLLYLLYEGARAKKLTFGKTLVYALTMLVLIFLFGSYIFIKNYLYLGNPFFPVNIKIFGKTVFKGLLDSVEYKMQVASWRLDLGSILFKEGLGLQFLLLILPATFIPLFTYGFWRRKFANRLEYFLLFITPLLMLIIYCLTINIYTMRYLYPYFSLGLLIAVIFLNKFTYGGKYAAFAALLSIVVASFELANGVELVAASLLSITLFIILIIFKQRISVFYKSHIFFRFLLLVALLVSVLFVYLNYDYDKEEFNRYPLSFSKKESAQRDIGRGWKALNDLTGPGARVAYTGRQEYYPLFGRGLKNRPMYVSVNRKDMTPYNAPDGKYRRIKDFSAWRENLKSHDIGYLFIAQPISVNRESEDPNKFPIEDEWAMQHPDEFELLFSNTLSRIYKVKIK